MRRMLFASLSVLPALGLLAACAPALERTTYVAPGTVVTTTPPTGVVVAAPASVVVASVAPVNGRCPAGMNYNSRVGYCVRY